MKLPRVRRVLQLPSSVYLYPSLNPIGVVPICKSLALFRVPSLRFLHCSHLYPTLLSCCVMPHEIFICHIVLFTFRQISLNCNHRCIDNHNPLSWIKCFVFYLSGSQTLPSIPDPIANWFDSYLILFPFPFFGKFIYLYIFFLAGVCDILP